MVIRLEILPLRQEPLIFSCFPIWSQIAYNIHDQSRFGLDFSNLDMKLQICTSLKDKANVLIGK